MKIIETIKIALKNIWSNKLRSALTMLGLIIGIASVIILVGIGNGASSQVKNQVQSLGTDVLTVSITSSDASLEYSQMDEILALDNVKSVAPYKTVSATVSRGTTTSSKASIIATNNNYLDVTNVSLSEGRTISIIDIENESKVCIIGSDLATTLFNLADPVGQTVKINGDNYTVIGVLEEQGSSMGTDIDEMLIIPITTARYLGTDSSINNLYVKIEDSDKITKTESLIENYIRSTLEISSDYYSVSSQDSVLSTMQNVTNTMSLLLAGIASISLIVGGIGVMNVMLVSVTERTKEIGIRKSLGAKRRNILMQFLIESVVICILGGIIGIVSGIGIGNIAQNFGYTFTSSSSVIWLSFGTSALIGIVFGIFPAYRAAKLNPIDALHTE
jgi:putative ABC transport system permease protein